VRSSVEGPLAWDETQLAGDLPRAWLLLLGVLFYLMCWGLGYATLNGIDWRAMPGGLTDLPVYAAMVTGAPAAEPGNHMQFRLLNPYLARPFHHLAKSHIRSWALPLWAILGALAKESFVPFMVVFTLSWWLCKTSLRNRRGLAIWVVMSWVAAFASLSALQYALTHVVRSPLQFGLELHKNSAYLSQFVSSLQDRNLWYVFLWLLPLSLFRLKQFPQNWRVAVAATSVTVFALDGYYGGAPGAVARALFSTAGPLLTASAALLLFGHDYGCSRRPQCRDKAR
jgi:hypothetical protein